MGELDAKGSPPLPHCMGRGQARHPSQTQFRGLRGHFPRAFLKRGSLPKSHWDRETLENRLEKEIQGWKEAPESKGIRGFCLWWGVCVWLFSTDPPRMGVKVDLHPPILCPWTSWRQEGQFNGPAQTTCHNVGFVLLMFHDSKEVHLVILSFKFWKPA